MKNIRMNRGKVWSSSLSTSTNQGSIKLAEILHLDIFLKISTDLLLFLQDRLEGLDDISLSQVSWAVHAVDLLDEIRLMKDSYTDDDVKAIAFVREKIMNRLIELNAEIIDQDSWNPNIQRAISVKRDADVSAERIERKGLSGLIMNGEIISSH